MLHVTAVAALHAYLMQHALMLAAVHMVCVPCSSTPAAPTAPTSGLDADQMHIISSTEVGHDPQQAHSMRVAGQLPSEPPAVVGFFTCTVRIVGPIMDKRKRLVHGALCKAMNLTGQQPRC